MCAKNVHIIFRRFSISRPNMTLPMQRILSSFHSQLTKKQPSKGVRNFRRIIKTNARKAETDTSSNSDDVVFFKQWMTCSVAIHCMGDLVYKSESRSDAQSSFSGADSATKLSDVNGKTILCGWNVWVPCRRDKSCSITNFRKWRFDENKNEATQTSCLYQNFSSRFEIVPSIDHAASTRNYSMSYRTRSQKSLWQCELGTKWQIMGKETAIKMRSTIEARKKMREKPKFTKKKSAEITIWEIKPIYFNEQSGYAAWTTLIRSSF